MKDMVLFQARNGEPVTNQDIVRCLARAGAHEASQLFIHSDMSFGIPNPDLKKSELLAGVLEAVREMGVGTVFFPTFTFSFCNNEDYDVRKTPSRMGALNEYARRLPEAVRSRDPMMSVVALGRDANLVENLGKHSVGAESAFDRLHQKDGTRFLFLGALAAKCMTYVHYVEERRGVPYRYNRDFTGNIVDAAGSTEETYTLYVRYRGVVPSERGELEQCLLDRNLMVKERCGDSFVSVVGESEVFQTVMESLDRNIDALLAEPYPRDNLDPFFIPHKMVAL
jgi:aminoglycoside 3-N-acetyltransferase